ncbi:cysteine proteinase [Trametes sanguinea]|nr:cysteine proteinase [Trametes sanguinea]
MASPHTPYHPQPGPSYYAHPPPPPPPHYAYPPAPGPTPYYPYPMPPMNGPAPMHQPASPRINGGGRGRFNSHRGGGPGYPYQPHMPQHHMPPPAVPVQSPPPVSPASPFHHPQKFVPHPHGHPHQVPYGSPYHHPQPNGPYPPAWPGQTLSPLPKQLSMLPPMVSAEHVPQVQVPPPQQHQHLHHQGHVPPPPQLSPEMSQHLQATPIPVPENQSPQVPSPTAPPFVPRQSQVQVTQPAPQPVDPQPAASQPIEPQPAEPVQVEVTSDEPPSPQSSVPQIREPEPEPEVEPTAAEEVSDVVEAVEVHESRPSTPRSPSPAPTPSPSFLSTYVIWSRRPGDPVQAPGVIISTRAYPPDDVAQKAVELPSPPASPKPKRVTLPKSSNPPATHAQETLPESVRAPSVSTNDTTPAGSIGADTPVPGSPYSCATSISAAVGSPSASQAPKSPVSPRAENKAELPSGGEISSEGAPMVSSDSGATQLTSEVQATQESPAASASSPTAPAAKPAPGPKRSWASVAQSSDSAASSSKLRLPVSNVVGFSISATSGPSVAPTPGSSLASANRNELLNLLSNGPSGSSANVAAAMKIRPRGLVNTGNMCFANAVLQILVYCPPFHRFFSELRKHLAGPVVGSQRNGTKATPLVDATIQFLKEFVPDPPAPDADSKSKGKEREDDLFDELDSFIPTYVYEAMKEKKRFANMIGGHQEDAEEFLGFFLDTLEEELLSISQSLSPKEPAKDATEEAQTQDGEWLEVGKKNKAVTTRSTKSTDSPITRIFGGKFRSTLRTPHQRDSVTIEDWRSLQLDIQPENVKTLRDALQHISHPQQVQISIPTRPTPIEATQQVLIEALPPVLILHMKRFLYDTKVGDVVKLGKQVSFSPELEIGADLIAPAKRTAQPVKYQLFGVLYHHGPSASGGHYTLDVLHPNRELSDRPRQAWIRIDDELVSDVRPDDVFGGLDRDDRHAYLLFYRRMTAWGPSRTK